MLWGLCKLTFGAFRLPSRDHRPVSVVRGVVSGSRTLRQALLNADLGGGAFLVRPGAQPGGEGTLVPR